MTPFRLCLIGLLLTACSDSQESPSDDPGVFDAGMDSTDSATNDDVQADAQADAPFDGASTCGELGSTRCVGVWVETCEPTGWSEPVECPLDQGCRDDACQEHTTRQVQQAASVQQLIDTLSRYSGWHEPVDASAVKERERRAILKGDGSDQTYFASAWRAMNAYPQGHQSLYSLEPGVCGTLLRWQATSRFGVCARPVQEGLIITFAKDGNPLGLHAGDVITHADGVGGDAMLATAYLQPVCGSVFPSAAGRRHAAAASFFGTVETATTLRVRTPEGKVHDVIVSDVEDTATTDCTDPFARNRWVYAETTIRSDGVAVIRLPSFFPFDKEFPTDPKDFDAFIEAYQNEMVKIFEPAKSAKAIVWDARGNAGGITPVALAIIGGFPSARPTSVSYCRSRVVGSSPPSFDDYRYAIYEVTPGGPFSYSGKVAIVVDGLAYSAGDYFPFAALQASDAVVVGSPSAGAFGGGHGPIPLAGPPALEANFDPAACFDHASNGFLEANPASPTVEIEYDPADLAKGRDTLLERAIQQLEL